jgi:hypothetical protein
MMMRYINIVMVAMIAVMIFLSWGTPAVYGWTVALAGWAPWMFEPLGERRGNS